jgi:excisionase family DNA binding protein
LKHPKSSSKTPGLIFEIPKAEHYLSVKDVAETYGVSQKTVRGWIYKKLLLPERIGPRLIRFKKSYIEQWISKFKGEIHGSV